MTIVAVNDSDKYCDNSSRYFNNSSKDRSLFNVMIPNHQIETVITYTPAVVDRWIDDILFNNQFHLTGLNVGINLKWNPSSSSSTERPRVATLHLCVDDSCLIFQIIRAPLIPQSIVDFLLHPCFRFVTVGIEEAANNLSNDWKVNVKNKVDLKDYAVNTLGETYSDDVYGLAKKLLGIGIQRPEYGKFTSWDDEVLNLDHVGYGCMDAYLSYAIGRYLIQA